MKSIFKHLLLVCLAFFCIKISFSQAPAIEWEKVYGGTNMDIATSIQQTNDGGYIIAGYTYSNDGNVVGIHGNGTSDFWIIKLSITGNIEWTKALGGSGEDEANQIIQTNDGGYIVAGYAYSHNGDVGRIHGTITPDAWIVKLSATGIIEWKKFYGGTSYEIATSIIQTNDGGYIFTGISHSRDFDVTTNNGHYDYWIVKISNTGNIQWQKSIGGYGQDEGVSIEQTNDGGYIVGGIASNNGVDVTGNHGNYDYWVVKLSSSGTIVWQKSFGGSSYEYFASVRQTSDNGYIVAGTTHSSDGDVTENFGALDYWVLKLDSLGNIIWQKSYGGINDDWAKSIQLTKDGGYIIAGYSNSFNVGICFQHKSDYWIVKIDSLGNIEWQKNYGGSGSEIAYDIKQTNDNGYIIAGYSSSSDGDVSEYKGAIDYWIVKLHPCNKITVINDSICSNEMYTLPKGNIVNVSGLYKDTFNLTNGCDSIVYTCLKIINIPVVYKSITMCNGGIIKLNNGIEVTKSGVYHDTISRVNSCDSVVVYSIDFESNVTNVNISICEGKTYMLPNGRIVSNAGIYTDTIKKINTCDSIVITNLSVFPNSFSVALQAIDTIDAGTSITLQPTYTNKTAINWNWTPSANLSCTSCENPTATLSQNAQYMIKATAQNGCEDTAITTIFVRQLEIYVPAAFSPNNDNVNDEFTVFATNLNTFSLKIYNRYGELVFESNDINTKWNGTYKGENCAVDSYSFIIDATQHNKNQIHKQGTILLVR